MISLTIDATVRDRLSEPERRRLRRRLSRMVRAAWLSESPTASVRPFDVSVRLTDDEVIRQLNRDFRGRDRPTDVLAFAMREAVDSQLHPEILGDVVISLPTAARQARRGVYDELMFLCAHGLCHLLGYDHRTDAEETEMNARMRALLTESTRRGPTRPA